jgi:tetratricopeptide (TPR) repeat protein
MSRTGPKTEHPVRPRRRSRTIPAVCLALAVLAGGRFASANPAPGSTGSRYPMGGLEHWKDGLELLHSSRVDESLAWFLARQRERPDDVCGHYFPALIYSNYDVDGLTNEEEDERGRRLLEEGIGAGEDRVDDGADDLETRYCLGALHGLRAAERLKRSKYLGAAFDARRARRIMLDLVDDEPECVDCRFWIGSYDYFADVLPGVIKFFRTLLFFPKGDRERGLATLRDVAERGTFDRYNALWILYTLYRGLEEDPQRARETLERVLAVYPDCVDAQLALAWHHARNARPPDRARGIALHLQSLEWVARAEAGSGGRLSEKVRISLCLAYLDDLQPEAGVAVLRPALRSARGHEERELDAALHAVRAMNRAGRHDEAVRLLDDVKARYPDAPQLESLERETQAFDASTSRTFGDMTVPWRMGRGGDVNRAEAAFRELMAKHDAKGLIHFGMAGMYFDLERYDEAEAHYRSAIAAGIAGPTHYTPISFLRIGHLLDLRGERRDAKSFYRKAASVAGEHEWVRHAAKHYRKEPYTGASGEPPTR